MLDDGNLPWSFFWGGDGYWSASHAFPLPTRQLSSITIQRSNHFVCIPYYSTIHTFLYCNANLEQLTTVSLFLGKRHQTVGVSCSTALCIACITIIACSRPALKCSRANTPRWRLGRGICSRCILYFVFGLWGGGGLVHLLRNIWPILDRGTQLICFECLLNTLWSTTLHSRMVKVDNTMSRVSSIFGQGEKTNIRRHLNICPTHV